jgi:predicted PurR-regulated permease PerM
MKPDAWLQLGVAGAALFIVLVFVTYLFKYITKQSNSENKLQSESINRLCDKIDNLIASNGEYTQKLSEVLITSEKDTDAILSILRTQSENITDVQRRVVRIDDRTFKCLGNDTNL